MGVANLCAFPREGQQPDWRLLRMQRNDGAPRPNRVTESLSDGLGAIDTQDLKNHLREREAGVKFKAATTAQDNPLTPEALEQLFIDEVTAMDTDLEERASQGPSTSPDNATPPPATSEEVGNPPRISAEHRDHRQRPCSDPSDRNQPDRRHLQRRTDL